MATHKHAHLIRNTVSKFRHSFFWRFFTSYILIFLIPFGTILFTYRYASQSVEESILRSNSNILYQFFLNVDSVFLEMDTMGTTLTNSHTVRQFATQPKTALETPSIKSYYLNELIGSFEHNDFDNTFIIFHKYDKIYNGKNGLDGNLFYHTYYKDAITYPQFEQLLNKPYKNYRSEILSINDNPENPLLAVTFSRPASNSFHGAADITAVITLSPEKLQKLFANSSIHSDGILMIMNQEHKLLASSHPISGDILADLGVNEPSYHETYQSKDYVLQFFPSQTADCIYVSAIPNRIFWEQLNDLRLISLLSILLCTILSCFLAWKMARRNYSPITGILDTINKSTGEVYDSNETEFTFISDFLSNSLNQITTLTKKLEVHVDVLRNNFLMQAMLGNYTDQTSDRDEDVFLKHHITLLADMFGIILMNIDEVDSRKLGNADQKQTQQIIPFIIANVIEELCAKTHQCFIVPTQTLTYACIINFSRGSDTSRQQDDMSAITARCTSFLAESFGLVITSALSGIHSNLPGLHTAYLEAQAALSYRYANGRGQMISYQEIQAKVYNYTSIENEKYEQLLLSYIKGVTSHGDSRWVISEIKNQSGITENSSLEAITCYNYALLIQFSRIIHELKASALPEAESLNNHVLHDQTFAELEDYFIRLLDALKDFHKDSQKTVTICDQVEDYLQQHFQNPELSNVFLGETFLISHAYLSRMYKVQKGVSITDSLYQLRIRHAKILLETTNDTLDDIAVNSGFLSSSTFIKIFKKSEGITPGAYRKLKHASETN